MKSELLQITADYNFIIFSHNIMSDEGMEYLHE